MKTKKRLYNPPVKMEYAKFARTAAQARKFSIVIPTWNNLAVLQWCIDAVRKNSAFKHQIIVHINDGSDGTLEWVRRQPDIDYTHSPENIGICYAMNLAAGLAVTDYIVYLNDDMYVCPQWDAAFNTAIQKAGHTFFFFSGTLIEPLPACEKYYGVPTNFGTTPATFDEPQFLKFYAAMPKNDRLGACNPPNIVHRDIWNMAGGYSIEFSPGFGSDPDFVIKLWQLGVRHFITSGQAVSYHLHQTTTSRLNKTAMSHLRQPTSRDTLVTKWGFPQGGVAHLFAGLPAAPPNETLPVHIPLARRIFYKMKYLHCALRYIFCRQQKV